MNKGTQSHEGKIQPVEEQLILVEREMLLRKVPYKFIRPDNTITNEAFRPRKRDQSETGYEKNVSTGLKNCYPDAESLERFNFARTIIYEINSEHPNSRGYQCINTHECHVGITGDMKLLYEDLETLEYLAINSNRLFP